MRLQSSVLLLSLAVLAASCGKSNYAQVEPDDLYFTHKDRKTVIVDPSYDNTPIITTVEPTEVPTEYNPNDYANQHSPVLVSPSLGSPTIQQYGQEPYYDTSVNPDYLYEQDYTDWDSTSNEYYVEGYGYDYYSEPPVSSTPQVNNYYYGYPSSYSGMVWHSPRWSSMQSPRYGSYANGMYYDSYSSPFCWDYDDWGYLGSNGNDFLNAYYGSVYYGSPAYYKNRLHNKYMYYGGYGYQNANYGYANYNYGSYGNNYGNVYYGGTNNSGSSDLYYKDGTKVINKPRQSRNSGEYYVEKGDVVIKSRRENYRPETNQEGGRIATNSSTAGRTNVEAERVTYSRRGNSVTYTNNSGKTALINKDRKPASVTVQQYRSRSQQGNRTVVVPTRTRSTVATRTSGANTVKTSRNTNANRSVGVRTGGSNVRSSSRGTKYTAPANSRSNTSYGTRSSNSSRSSGTRSVSSGRTRSSSGSSYRAPSRSSGSSSRSYTPSRSSSNSRSSGTSTKSSGSSGRKRN